MLSGIYHQQGFGFLIDINLGYNDYIETTQAHLRGLSAFLSNNIAFNQTHL